ncbi:DUF1361 domain-containing protein [Prosthecobacter sp.]|uniref:DUF1361 domain-containing protein n=1 Tax=Prosthecobacter sp. TaxID=1965333 RepID=UPI001D2919FE|nr:DUF1361 domain-containing protein [Prosthecobacter sp.]MCB1276728.1 DUF1361 domain-containing protein [Prosthecobacter sp.]
MSFRVLLLNLLACLGCLVVLKARFVLAGHHYYAFLLWNLFLAAIPLGLSLGLSRITRLSLALPLLAVWLLFFPNAPYVLTDLMHLNEHNGNVPKWLDLLMLLSFGLVSLGFGFQSLQIVQHWFAQRFSRLVGWCVVLGTLALSGFGVYLGRFLRWNSWDILQRPQRLFQDIISRLVDPFQHSHTWSFTLGFSTLLVFTYLFWISAATPRPVPSKID